MPEKEVWDTYPEIYHYTSFSSALLIIHSATLRATRFDLLNDTQEIHYAKAIIADKLLEKIDDITIENAKLAVDFFHEPLGNGFYFTSFCGINSDVSSYHHDNGILSMWRNYGNNGGCALGFQTKNLYERATNCWETYNPPPACVMDKVIYKEVNDDDPDYRDKLNNFTTRAKEIMANPNDRDFDRTRTILENFLCLLICTKHPAFFEEREVRLGLCFIKNLQAESQIYSPQQFHSLSFSPEEDITRIIIGPHRDQQERYEFIKSYLSKFGLENIEVTKSEIPLRT